MKKLIFMSLATLLTACHNEKMPTEQAVTNEKTSSHPNKITVNRDSILRDYMAWYRYAYFNVKLSQNFIGLDVDSLPISKPEFLNKMIADGNKVPFHIGKSGEKAIYKLSLIRSLNKDISVTNKQLARIELEHSKMEGKKLPQFNFRDINGKAYSSANTKGKTHLLKCWFINCTACVAEFPELNRLVEKYKDRKDLLFVSLALDNKTQLQKFLLKKPFSYAVVPEQQEFMSKLRIAEYPTHLLIDRNGQIVKVVGTIEELIPFLEPELEKG